MNSQITKTFPFHIIFSFTLLILVFAIRPAYACQADVLPVCVEYSKSDLVFSGTLTKSFDDESSLANPRIINTFTVNKIFKGKTTKTVQVKFLGGECGFPFEVGKEYLVYAKLPKEGSIFNTDFSSNVDLIEKSAQAIKEINILRKSKSAFLIYVNIHGLDSNDLNKINLKLRDGNGDIPFKYYRDIGYIYKLTKNKKLKVILEIPSELNAWISSIGTGILNTESIPKTQKIEYEVKYSPDSCDIKSIWVEKD